MIGNRPLIALAVAAVLAVIAAVASQPEEPGQVAEAAGEPVLPDLDRATLKKADNITVTGPEQEVRLQKSEQGWQIANLDGYPAQAKRVQRALAQLLTLKKREPKTANADFYDRLELVAPGGEKGGQATQITVKQGDETLAQVLKGKSYEPGFGERSGLYVRRVGQKRSWLAEGSLETWTARPQDWADTQISDIPSDKLARLELRGGGRSAPLAFARQGGEGDGKGKLAPVGPAADLAIKNRKPLEDAAGFLANLSFKTVASADSIAGEAGATARFTTQAGLQVRVGHRVVEGKHWITLRPARTEAAGEKQAKRVAKLDERWSGWAYQVEADTGKLLRLTRKDLEKAPDS